MDPFLRLLQITLITTQIYQSDAQNTSQTISLSSSTHIPSLVTSSSTHIPSLVDSSSTQNTISGTNVHTSSAGTIGNTPSVQPSTTSSQPPMSTTSGDKKTTVSLPGNTSQSRYTTQPDLSTSPRITTNITPSRTLSTSFKNSTTTGVGTTSAVMQASSVFAQSTQAASPKSQNSVVTSKSSESLQLPGASQMSSVTEKSKEPASHTSTLSESTNATSVSHSGSFSRQTHYTTVNYSSSSASLQSSIDVTTVPTTTAASSTIKSLTPSPVSLNWTNWSVGKEDCQKYCSEKGGTATASRQCYSHSVTMDDSVCTNHNISITQVVECDEPYCPISGTEALRSSIFTVGVGISLILLTTFVGG